MTLFFKDIKKHTTHVNVKFNLFKFVLQYVAKCFAGFNILKCLIYSFLLVKYTSSGGGSRLKNELVTDPYKHV